MIQLFERIGISYNYGRRTAATSLLTPLTPPQLTNSLKLWAIEITEWSDG